MVRQKLFNKRKRIKNVVLITLCTALIGTNTGVIEAGTLNDHGTMISTAVCTDNVTSGDVKEPHRYSAFSDDEDENTDVISFERGDTASENNGTIGYCVVGEKVPVTPYFTSRSKIKVVSGYEKMAKINKRGILVGRKPGTVKITDGLEEKNIAVPLCRRFGYGKRGEECSPPLFFRVQFNGTGVFPRNRGMRLTRTAWRRSPRDRCS